MGLRLFLAETHGWCWVAVAAAFVAGYFLGGLRQIQSDADRPAKDEKEDVVVEPNRQQVVIDSLWRFRRDTGDPFPQTGPPVARVLEVRDGWVRYRIANCSGDNRRKLDSFLYCYEPA